jgi:hypothetical protein
MKPAMRVSNIFWHANEIDFYAKRKDDEPDTDEDEDIRKEDKQASSQASDSRPALSQDRAGN